MADSAVSHMMRSELQSARTWGLYKLLCRKKSEENAQGCAGYTEITLPQETDPFAVLKHQAAQVGFYTYDTPGSIAFEGIPEVQACLQGNAQSKKKADNVHEARVLAKGMPLPPLAKKDSGSSHRTIATTSRSWARVKSNL